MADKGFKHCLHYGITDVCGLCCSNFSGVYLQESERMKVAVIPWNDEWRAGIIFSAIDYADRVLVITSSEIVEGLARLFGAEVVKLDDYDKINAVYLGLKKAREMGCKPVVILEDLSKDEFPSIAPLLKCPNLSLDLNI